MNELKEVEVFAGLRPDGEPVAEKMQVKVLGDGEYELVRSPCFVKGLASGDAIKFDEADNSFEITKHSGNLCIRVIARESLSLLAQDLTPLIEQLGGSLDFETPRMLVFSIHVSCGFKEIEAILNDNIDEDSGSIWFYSNVYDPLDGVTPLNWWLPILQEK